MILMCRQKVADFETWKAVFDTHAEAHAAAELRFESLMRNVDDQNDVIVYFSVGDEALARAFVTSAGVPEAQREAGLLGPPDIVFLD